MASKPMFRGPSLSSSSGNWLPLKSVCVIIHLPKPLVHCWWRDKKVGGRSQVPAPLGPAFTFIIMLVTSDQAWLSTKPPSLLKLFLFRCISIASFASRSSCPDVLSNIEAPIKSIKYPLLMMCFATAEFSGSCRGTYLWCSLHLVLIGLPVCSTKNFPHTHRIRYTPGTFKFLSSLSVSLRFSCLECFI